MKPKNLRTEIADLERTLANKRSALETAERICRHDWGPTEPDHIYHEAYTIRGDRPGDPGYGGVDRQFDCYVPAETKHRWKRECRACGKVEHTERTTENVTHTPVF